MIRKFSDQIMKKLLALFLLFSIVLVSCTSGEEKIKEISWIVGTWEGIDDNELIFVEVWTKGDGNWMNGKGATLTPDGDTLFKETLKIELVEGTPYYVATVPENPGPVLFKMVEGDATHCVFENPDHDFPQRIEYSLQTNSTLLVKLEGIENGTPKTEALSFEKNTGVSLLPGVNSDSIIWDLIMQDSVAADSLNDSIK
jgi:hypothetical protein